MAAKILFLVPYPLKESPSQRFRFEQYFSLLKKRGHVYHVQSFLDSRNWQLFYKRGNALGKSFALINGWAKRIFILFKAHRYDFVFIHREVAPVGPPLVEWVLAKLLRKKIIYDFDDAIWLTDRRHEPFFLRIGKWRRKVGSICRWAHRVSCGNAFLCSYAAKFNHHVAYNPTTIDTSNVHNPSLYHPKKTGDKISIGWTGSHSTLKYLYPIERVLKRIVESFPNVEVVVIANEKPSFTFSRWRFMEWNAKTEIEDLMEFDIGIMPLPEDEWSKGKCGFKALQYMALKIPAVVSPVGVNTAIVEQGVDGFLANTDAEWFEYLSLLIEDESLRKEMGERGRNKVVERYSVESNTKRFLSLFE